jgi:hypothetical protein
MRSTLFVSTLLASALFAGSALADRTGDDSASRPRPTNVRELKERIVHESTDKHETAATKQATEKAPVSVEQHRQKGDLYDHYGQKPATAPAQVAAPVSSTQKAPQKLLLPGRSHGDVIDPVSKKSHAQSSTQATVGSTQLTWSAGAKNVRSFVHFTNDKGQTNNNIHGATASAEKMRLCAKVIMGTAGAGMLHVFSWQTAGGDNQSLFPGAE